MDNNTMKRYLTSLVIRELQFKTTRHHVTPRMALIKSGNWIRLEKVEPSYTGCGEKTVQLALEKSFPPMIKLVTIWLSNSMPGYKPREIKTCIHTKTYTGVSIAETKVRLWRKPARLKHPLRNGLNKMCIPMQRDRNHPQRNGILGYATTWTDLENVMLSQSSQSQKTHPIHMTCTEQGNRDWG